MYWGLFYSSYSKYIIKIFMKILHVTNNYPTLEYPIFGIFVKEQIESLQKIGVECDVFYCNGQNKGFRKYITYLPGLWKKALFGGYDLIHCHHALSAALLCMTGAPLFKKCIVSYQSRPEYEWGYALFKILRFLFNIVIVKFEPGELSHKKIYYLPNGCNQDLFRPMDKDDCKRQLGLYNDKRYVLFTDSNRKVRGVKRVDRFEAAVSVLRSKYKYDNIEPVILRNTPREQIPIYMNACELYMLTSDIEGSPNSVKECMCCNTPVVSTDVGNVKAMIGDIEGAYVVDEMSPEALAEACDKVFRRTTPFNGREKILAKGYGIATVAKKLKALYEKIINE